jgi:HNH endonuclease
MSTRKEKYTSVHQHETGEWEALMIDHGDRCTIGFYPTKEEAIEAILFMRQRDSTTKKQLCAEDIPIFPLVKDKETTTTNVGNQSGSNTTNVVNPLSSPVTKPAAKKRKPYTSPQIDRETMAEKTSNIPSLDLFRDLEMPTTTTTTSSEAVPIEQSNTTEPTKVSERNTRSKDGSLPKKQLPQKPVIVKKTVKKVTIKGATKGTNKGTTNKSAKDSPTKTKKRPSHDIQLKIISDQNNKCACCMKRLVHHCFDFDHIIPQEHGDEHGGVNERINLQALCADCHALKSRTIDRTMIKPRIEAGKPMTRMDIVTALYEEYVKSHHSFLECKKYRQKLREKTLALRNERLKKGEIEEYMYSSTWISSDDDEYITASSSSSSDEE